MTQEEVVNSIGYKAAKEAVNRYQTNQELDIDSFEEGAKWGYELAQKELAEQVPYVPYSYDSFPCCQPNGVCTNPQMDCINCPKRGGGAGTIVSINTPANTTE